jgi:hypothetical protein
VKEWELDLSRAEHLRQRDEKLRTIAESMRNQDARESLLQLALNLDPHGRAFAAPC